MKLTAKLINGEIQFFKEGIPCSWYAALLQYQIAVLIYFVQ